MRRILHRCLPRSLTREDSGQVLPLFALGLVAILALMGLGLDAAQAFLERRVAQSVADLASLSGARFLPGDPSGAIAEATSIGVANGYDADAVLVTTPYEGDASRIQVTIDSNVHTFFLPVLGINDMDVNGGAAAAAVGAAASCSFCSLNSTDKNHTLLLKNGSTLRVDGDIIVNSTNGGVGPDCTLYEITDPDKIDKKAYQVCGDGFDIFGTPVDTPTAWISAQSIQVAGGWETHDQNVVVADSLTIPDYSTFPPTYITCPTLHPDPPAQTQTANVCIHRPQIVDPLNNPDYPASMVSQPDTRDYTVPTAANCPDGTIFPSTSPANTSPLVIASSQTICPGLYYGGISITGGTTTMLPGVYFMEGKNGFVVSGDANVDGTAGVMIYSSATINVDPINILPNPDLVSTHYPARLTPIFNLSVDHNPGAVDQTIKYKAELTGVNGDAAPYINGTLDFYDGDTKINPTVDCPDYVVTDVGKKKGFDCKVTYNLNEVGTHGIAAVFTSSDTCTDNTCYDNAEVILDPREEIVPTTDTAGDIKFTNTGYVKLAGIKTGQYKGIVMFQDRDTAGDITLSYGSGLPACSPTDTITVNGVEGPRWSLEQPPPGPCGALGAISGTIYAANDDSLVTTTVSGAANIQIISGKMLIDSTAVTRFSYTDSLFAGGWISLIE